MGTQSRVSDGDVTFRALLLLIVIVSHGGLFWLLTREITVVHDVAPPVVPVVVLAPAAATRHHFDAVPLSEVRPKRPWDNQSILLDVRFIDPDADLVPGVIAPLSAPRIDASQSLEGRWYALRAGMEAGQAATVILSVEVRADGTVGDVGVLSSAGKAAIDDEAIAYVRSLHWIPGSIRRHAQTMRVRWPVTLRVGSAEGSDG